MIFSAFLFKYNISMYNILLNTPFLPQHCNQFFPQLSWSWQCYDVLFIINFSLWNVNLVERVDAFGTIWNNFPLVSGIYTTWFLLDFCNFTKNNNFYINVILVRFLRKICFHCWKRCIFIEILKSYFFMFQSIPMKQFKCIHPFII